MRKLGESGGRRHWPGAAGGLVAALAVALAAYAAHAATPVAQSRLYLAAAFAFGHGLALAVLAPAARRRMARLALWMLGIGVLLFAGSLVANVLAGAPTLLAPAGGMLMIGGWLLHAADALRHDGDD